MQELRINLRCSANNKHEPRSHQQVVASQRQEDQQINILAFTVHRSRCINDTGTFAVHCWCSDDGSAALWFALKNPVELLCVIPPA